jgi:lysophospholipase L1-like esterase
MGNTEQQLRRQHSLPRLNRGGTGGTGRRLASWLTIVVVLAIASVVGSSAPPVAGIADRPNAVIIGDSITAFHEPALAVAFRDRGIPNVTLDAQQARQIEASVTYADEFIRSGISAISQLQNSGVNPKLWIIELGANDVWTSLGKGRDEQVAYAYRLIGQLLDTLGPAAQVAWVTVSFRTYPLESDAFNEALRQRAAIDPRMTLVDWHALSVTHPEWFTDPVHPNELGAMALGRLYVDSVLELLESPAELPCVCPEHAERMGMS